MSTESTNREIVRRVVNAYDNRIVRAYCTIRFIILHQRFLDEIEQYLPETGTVLDVGCGFGLFSLYYASTHPNLNFVGLDLNPRRIEMAQKAARRLKLDNVQYELGDARSFSYSGKIHGAYMLDLIHHIPVESVESLIHAIADRLVPQGRMIIKDIEPSPFCKMAFTWVLDKLMDFRSPIHYWQPSQVKQLLLSQGFGNTYKHSLLDYLPYPHVIHIAEKAQTNRLLTTSTARASDDSTSSPPPRRRQSAPASDPIGFSDAVSSQYCPSDTGSPFDAPLPQAQPDPCAI